MTALKLFVAGRPGIGKTTLVQRVVAPLQHAEISVNGFTTGEIRVDGRRVGFEITALGGETRVLAHTDFSGLPKVGRYGVDVAALEEVALPALHAPADICVIDEIGKMELLSDRFRARVGELLDRDRALLATVHVHRHPVTDRWKQRPDVEILEIDRANRDELAPAVVDRLLTAFRRS